MENDCINNLSPVATVPAVVETPEPFSSNNLETTSVKSGELHGALDAWSEGVNGTGVKVAIVDSGIDFAHPDLNGTQARVNDSNNSYLRKADHFGSAVTINDTNTLLAVGARLGGGDSDSLNKSGDVYLYKLMIVILRMRR